MFLVLQFVRISSQSRQPGPNIERRLSTRNPTNSPTRSQAQPEAAAGLRVAGAFESVAKKLLPCRWRSPRLPRTHSDTVQPLSRSAHTTPTPLPHSPSRCDLTGLRVLAFMPSLDPPHQHPSLCRRHPLPQHLRTLQAGSRSRLRLYLTEPNPLTISTRAPAARSLGAEHHEAAGVLNSDCLGNYTSKKLPGLSWTLVPPCEASHFHNLLGLSCSCFHLRTGMSSRFEPIRCHEDVCC